MVKLLKERLEKTIEHVDREKVLLVGRPGTRKSGTILEIAQLYPESNVVVIDPDDGISKLVNKHYGGWPEFPNLVYYHAPTWGDVEKAHAEVRRELGVGDWYCFDMVNTLWSVVREDYTNTVYKESLLEHKMKAKEKAPTKPVGFEGLNNDDWNLIKLMYFDIIGVALKRMMCNVLFTSAAKPVPMKVARDGSSTPLYNVDDHWVNVGYQPAGIEGTLESDVHTIMYLTAKETVARVSGAVVYGMEYNARTVRKDKGEQLGEFSFSDGDRNLWAQYCRRTGR